MGDLIARGHTTKDNGLTWQCKFCIARGSVTLQGGCEGLDQHIIVYHAEDRSGFKLEAVADA